MIARVTRVGTKTLRKKGQISGGSVRAGDHEASDSKTTNGLCCGKSCLYCGLDGSDITLYEGANPSSTSIVDLGDFNGSRLCHCIHRGQTGKEAHRLNSSNGAFFVHGTNPIIFELENQLVYVLTSPYEG